MRFTAVLILTGTFAFGSGLFGVWELNAGRSTFAGESRPKSLTLRIEPHHSGEVFTLETMSRDGRATTSGSVLYLDGKPRDFLDWDCAGTELSRQIDSQTVEILRKCGNGDSLRWIRRINAPATELILEIVEQRANGRRVESRVVLEKQIGGRN
jgi:hypothetical protein